MWASFSLQATQELALAVVKPQLGLGMVLNQFAQVCAYFADHMIILHEYASV